MKKWIAWVVLACLMISTVSAKAEEGTNVAAPQNTSGTVVVLTPTPTPIPTPTPEPTPAPLAEGDRGDAVVKLQRRLSELGFFTFSQDGIYGTNTKNAVLELEEYIRVLEQREIDAMLTVTPEPTSEPTPEIGEGVQAVETSEPTSEPTAEIVESVQAVETSEPTSEPTAEIVESVQAVETPEPTPTAVPTPAPTPKTKADGIADLDLQAIIYGDVDALYSRDIAQGSSGSSALRVQRRLIGLNYLNDTADGVFGVNSKTALMAFQKASGLEESGVADRQTQNKLFSGDAVASDKPVYNQLSYGMSGDSVKRIQKQLIYLGFMSGSATGYFSDGTKSGVQTFEKYLYQLDHPNVQAQPTVAPQNGSEVVDSASQEENLSSVDHETNPYEVQPEESAEPLQGFTPVGNMTHELQVRLLEDGIPIFQEVLQEGSQGDEVRRVQRRLNSLEYLTASGVDGIFGSGTRKAIKSFQNRNHMEKSGIADKETQMVLFSEDAVKAIKPYQIKVSVDDQRVYVYSPDEDDNYTELVKKFVCSTGTKEHPTPKGKFTNTGKGARWHYFQKFECWAQYAFYVDGDIMIHSVLFSEQDEKTLRQGSVNALGSRASHGCIRLAVEDAKWIWDHCGSGTMVVVY